MHLFPVKTLQAPPCPTFPLLNKNLMKHLLLLACAAVLGLTDAVAQKFGHLDAQEILLTLPERSDAQATIEAAASEYEAEVTRMQSELETKFAEYQAKAATWPDAIRQQKERELQQLDAGLQEFGMTIQNDLAQMEQQLLAPMVERVRKAIEDVGKEQGFTYIFDTSTGVTLYNGGEDVSGLVKTKLGM
jgi:outer membrane protein